MVSWAEIPLAPITESKRIKMDFFIDESSLTVYKAVLAANFVWTKIVAGERIKT